MGVTNLTGDTIKLNHNPDNGLQIACAPNSDRLVDALDQWTFVRKVAYPTKDANIWFEPDRIRGIESRFSSDNLHHNLTLVDRVKSWASRIQATPSQISLAWLLAQKPWIVPIPGTTQMPHMIENIGAVSIQFTPAELTELNQSVTAIQIRGARLPDAVQVFSDVEAPLKK